MAQINCVEAVGVAVGASGGSARQVTGVEWLHGGGEGCLVTLQEHGVLLCAGEQLQVRAPGSPRRRRCYVTTTGIDGTSKQLF